MLYGIILLLLIPAKNNFSIQYLRQQE